MAEIAAPRNQHLQSLLYGPRALLPGHRFARPRPGGRASLVHGFSAFVNLAIFREDALPASPTNEYQLGRHRSCL